MNTGHVHDLVLLHISKQIRCHLERNGISSIQTLLTKDFCKHADFQLSHKTVMMLIVALVDHHSGAEGDQVLLGHRIGEQMVILLKRKIDYYITLCQLDEKGRLSPRFKRWFNAAIDGHEFVFSPHKRRVYFVRPFGTEE